MAKVNLSIRRPAGADVTSWPTVSSRIMQLLYDKFGVKAGDDEPCSWALNTFMLDKDIRYVALQVFSNTLPRTIELVKGLTVVGDGACPECGANNRREITGGFCRNEYDQLCVSVVGYVCNVCEKEEHV